MARRGNAVNLFVFVSVTAVMQKIVLLFGNVGHPTPSFHSTIDETRFLFYDGANQATAEGY